MSVVRSRKLYEAHMIGKEFHLCCWYKLDYSFLKEKAFKTVAAKVEDREVVKLLRKSFDAGCNTDTIMAVANNSAYLCPYK